MANIGEYMGLAKSFSDIAWQSWYFHIFVNLAALGWAATSRKDGASGIPAIFALFVVIALLAFDLVTIGAAEHYTVRADLAHEYVRLIENGADPASLSGMRDVLFAPTSYNLELLKERIDSVQVFLGIDLLVALFVFVSLSRIGRH